jgi:hypothetical protein
VLQIQQDFHIPRFPVYILFESDQNAKFNQILPLWKTLKSMKNNFPLRAFAQLVEKTPSWKTCFPHENLTNPKKQSTKGWAHRKKRKVFHILQVFFPRVFHVKFCTE